MANATPSRLGQANLSGDALALFLKVFSGEVLTSYNAKTVMKDKTRVRNITSGKSAQFPAIGRTTAEYHTPGAEINGMNIEHGEKVITIDDLLISHAFIANIDEAKNHYEVRSEYAMQLGARRYAGLPGYLGQQVRRGRDDLQGPVHAQVRAWHRQADGHRCRG